jgi:hypothetical protein
VKTKYYLDEIDVSQLPLPVREQLDKGLEGSPYTAVGYASRYVEPVFSESTGKYYTIWMLMTETDDTAGPFMITKSPWVSPRIDKYLENIRIDKK